MMVQVIYKEIMATIGIMDMTCPKLITKENNEDIEQQSISYKSEIEDFFDRINKVFGYKIDVIDMNEMFKEAEDEVDKKEDDEDVIEK